MKNRKCAGCGKQLAEDKRVIISTREPRKDTAIDSKNSYHGQCAPFFDEDDTKNFWYFVRPTSWNRNPRVLPILSGERRAMEMAND